MSFSSIGMSISSKNMSKVAGTIHVHKYLSDKTHFILKTYFGNTRITCLFGTVHLFLDSEIEYFSHLQWPLILDCVRLISNSRVY